MPRQADRCVSSLAIALVLAGAATFTFATPINAAAPAAAASPAPAAAPPAGKDLAPAPKRSASTAGEPRLIDIHVGIPGYVYLGQPMKELTSRFPKATVTPFAGQEDALVVAVPDEGLSCYVVGPSRDTLKVASIGFNFDQVYMGAKEGAFRTREGIGKGSTVNDLLGTYGRPAEISGDRMTKSPMHRAQGDDPNGPKKYHYASADGATKTYFVVQFDRVLRVVVNDVAPLERHLLKRPPEK